MATVILPRRYLFLAQEGGIILDFIVQKFQIPHPSPIRCPTFFEKIIIY